MNTVATPLRDVSSKAAAANGSASRRGAPGEKANHQGRPQRILHLHHRRHRNDPQRLVQADAVASKARQVPLKIQYRYRPQEYGEQLVRMYLLTNDKESKLGTTPLPDGIVRVFRDNGRDGLSYLDAASDQVHPDRRQDRAEPRVRTRKSSSS